MTEFRTQDLSGATFELVNLTGATFKRVDFSAATITSARLNDVSMRDVDMFNVTIVGDIDNFVVNDVDIAPLVEAELDRRYPGREKMRAETPDEFRAAWALLAELWDATIERARSLEEPELHRSVNGEWSFIQTLRHLNFASAAWVCRMVLGEESPWHPLDLPWDDAPGWDGIPWDRAAMPSLDEVMAVRAERRAAVGAVIDALDDDRLAATVSQTAPGWPQFESFPLKQCLRIVLNEEWEHRRYAERDLAQLVQ